MSEFVSKVKDSFFPEEYAESLETFNELELCLVKKKAIARYCIAVLPFDSKLSMEKQISNARKLIRKNTNAFWLISEIGAYIIFHTPNKVPGMDSLELPVDKTGLHAVIVQGVHVIGNDYKKHIFNHSRWFEHAFGKTEYIMAKLKNL